MVSQFGSQGYTIMWKTADLTVVQKTIIDTIHKEGKPQIFIAKEAGCSQSAVSKHVNRKLSGRKKCGRKRCTTNREKPQPYEDWSSKIDSRIWVNIRRNGLRVGSRHQERVKEFGYSCRIPLVKPLLNYIQCQRHFTWAKKGEEELNCCPVVQSPLIR